MSVTSLSFASHLRRLSAAGWAVLFFVGSLQAAPQLGLQTWTCRKLSFEEMVSFAAEHRLTRIALFRAHVNPADPLEINAAKLRAMREAGLEPYTMYSAMGRDSEEDRKVFALARQFGMKFLVVEPRDLAKWPELLDEAKRNGVKLAVHNHGLETPYGDPATVRSLIHKYPDLQVCLDVGWVTAAGFDAAEVFRSYVDRVIDLHFKDKSVSAGANGKNQPVDTYPGEGNVNFTGLFKAIREAGWSGTMAIETDSDAFAADPRELVRRSIAYFQRCWKDPAVSLTVGYGGGSGDLAGLRSDGRSDDDQALIPRGRAGLDADVVMSNSSPFREFGEDSDVESDNARKQAK